MKTDKLRESRRRQILDLLGKSEMLSVRELSSRFQVSGATIRLDLQALKERKQVIRTHGSAMLVQKQPVSPLVERLRTQTAQKKAIARAAAALVRDGDIIGLDASSTALAMTSFLKDMEQLTIVTNSIAVANELIEEKHIQLIMPGGKVKHDSASLVGNGAVQHLGSLRLNTAFVGARSMGIPFGLGEGDEEEVEIKKKLLQIAQTRIGVIDSSKWNSVSLIAFADWETMDRIVTDDGLDRGHRQALEELGVSVRTVEVE
ncbi:MAG: DeoR/GlpR transcriptional regulator [Proteobacteria bacterium]|nr:DeoR/GlpR transcriptional regulator [Pseudomonadota bacterium]